MLRLKRIEEQRVNGNVTLHDEEELLIEVEPGCSSYSLPNTRYYQEYQLGNETRFSEVRYVAIL